ncbi:hypothetical protein L2E82_47584 [Cichorium intybus]|uniref:Uncharacterized protein n=1 Tax=Cichorium intybus TaxID=13427 RepID=A0ACB8YWY6_CICIN|nr:hypothetical protein L2E82_47584 [Cichorium intybus]
MNKNMRKAYHSAAIADPAMVTMNRQKQIHQNSGLEIRIILSMDLAYLFLLNPVHQSRRPNHRVIFSINKIGRQWRDRDESFLAKTRNESYPSSVSNQRGYDPVDDVLI